MSAHGPMPRSAWLYPVLAVLLFAAVSATGYSFAPSAAGWVFAAVLLVILFGTVFAAVHHAEMIAERIGDHLGVMHGRLLLYTSPRPRHRTRTRMPSSA